MLGQEKLKSKFDSYTLETLPSTILLLGEKGCGKHTFVKEIENKFNLQLIDMTNNINFDYISEVYLRAIPAFYLIDMNYLNEKQQNMILKFLEEPLKGSYIILISESKANLLDTILNRCMIFEFEPYSKEVLSTFVENKDEQEEILQLCSTPGQILNTNLKNLNDLYDLCNKIIYKIGQANYANTLSIVNKINLKDEYDKFDIQVFLNALLNSLLKEYQLNFNDKLYKMFELVLNEKKKLKDTRLNKEMFLENLLTNIWLLSREI